MQTPYQWLSERSHPARKPLTLNIIAGLLSGLCLIAQAFLLATLIDKIYLHNATQTTLTPLLYLFLMVIALRALLSFYREKWAFQTATLVKRNLRKQLFSVWMQSTYDTLSTTKTGALVSVFIEQIEALHGFFADYLPQMMITVLLPLIILCTVFPQNWLAGTLLLITAPLIPLFMALIGMHTAKIKQESFQLLAHLSAHFLNTLQGLSTLSLFNRAHAQTDAIRHLSDLFREKTMRILRIAFLSSAALELFSTISIAMIAVYLGLGLLGYIHIGFSGVHITLQKALFILLLAPEFYMPLRQLGAFYHARAEAIAAASEIMPLLRSAPASPSQQFVANHIDLSLNNITFAYAHKNVFENFSLDIPFGSCIAITGESGAGKSTLLHLIAKLLSPHSGDIIANSITINKIDNDDWRTQITLLHQHPRLHTGSIFENIQFAKSDATHDEIMHAAKEAGVTAFSNDLSDMIYEQNSGLSGGQIQRIALARIILRDAPIVLFDEPTNYLDEANIAIFWSLIEKWRGKKTLVIATHDEKITRLVDKKYSL